MRPLTGLTALPDEDLVQLLRLSLKGALPDPVTRWGLMLLGLNRIAEQADLLLGLDQRAVQAVLKVALAERRAAAERLSRGARPSRPDPPGTP